MTQLTSVNFSCSIPEPIGAPEGSCEGPLELYCVEGTELLANEENNCGFYCTYNPESWTNILGNVVMLGVCGGVPPYTFDLHGPAVLVNLGDGTLLLTVDSGQFDHFDFSPAYFKYGININTLEGPIADACFASVGKPVALAGFGGIWWTVTRVYFNCDGSLHGSDAECTHTFANEDGECGFPTQEFEKDFSVFVNRGPNPLDIFGSAACKHEWLAGASVDGEPLAAIPIFNSAPGGHTYVLSDVIHSLEDNSINPPTPCDLCQGEPLEEIWLTVRDSLGNEFTYWLSGPFEEGGGEGG